MRTNIVLDDRLVEEAFHLSGLKTKKDLVHEALKQFVEGKKRKNLMDLYGTGGIAEGYDYKALREGR